VNDTPPLRLVPRNVGPEWRDVCLEHVEDRMTERDDVDLDPETGAEMDSDQLTAEDMLLDRGVEDLLDEGYSPPERPGSFGHDIADEDAGHRDTLDERLSAEVPDVGADPVEESAEYSGGEVGTDRAGRLVDDNGGTDGDTDAELYAEDIGIDGAGASAEEAAVHVIEPDSGDNL
jgi:hypothetical protein